MSGELFVSSGGRDTKLFEGYDSKNVKHPITRRNGRDGDYLDSSDKSQGHLEEMQRQLGKAETRCNTLKEQLDYMKKVCQNNNAESATKTKKLRSRSSVNRSSNETVPPEDIDLNLPNKGDTVTAMYEKIILPIRQNSYAIGTDKTGAAVKTINNILSGITQSVNMLTELHMDEKKSRPCSRRKKSVGNDPKVDINIHTKDSNAQLSLPAEKAQEKSQPIITIESSTVFNVTRSRKRHRNKNNRQRSRNKVENSSASINLNNKKSIKSTAKHSEKRIKLNTVRTTMVESGSFTQKKRLFRRKKSNTYLPEKHQVFERNYYTDNLVELYHNKAVSLGSDSDENNHEPKIDAKISKKKNREHKIVLPKTCFKTQANLADSNESVPPLKIQEITDNYEIVKNELSPIQEIDYMEPPAAPRTEYSTCTKNYELPTIASKMKQVAKCYLRGFDFRAIPFCAAKSTSPSHNIGINIQQVMSIIKTRQPISGISPTLAHNIGLAAEKLNSRPLSALVSSLGSRITYGRSQCPLIRHQLNYQQLQEMAKEIPEEDFEACVVSEQNQINGASGDTEVHNAQGTVWKIDPLLQKSCTCYSQQGLGFQQVLSRYQSRLTRKTTGSQLHYKISTSRCRLPKSLQRFTCPPRRKSHVESVSDGTPLRGKERNLKDVLKHLHSEFEQLNQRYEELSKKISEGGEPTEKNLKDLESMEYELNRKEEEINMVMSLYKEVVSLKEQVKLLKDRASQASIIGTMNPMACQSRYSRCKEIKDSSAALHLTKILRQIQNYQESYKKEGRF